MNEEIEYAEMLEIPVSTVNVVKKKKKGKAQKKDERESLIDKVNEKINARAFEMPNKDAAIHAENDYKERVDTVAIENENYRSEFSEEPTPVQKPKKSKAGAVLTAEFAVACALCGGIFLTNVFMPQSAINTFFRSLVPQTEQEGARAYHEFTLASVVGLNADAEISVSPTGVLTFTAKGCVYPVADGEVAAVTKGSDGLYEVRVNYTDEFYGVLRGLDTAYYAAGESVKANIPVGYSNGEKEVEVTLYSGGELLNCFTLDEDNKPVWTQDKKAQ